MSQPQSSLLLHSQDVKHRHRNNFLFSDYYLNNLLFDSATWKAQIADALAFFEWLKGLYSAESAHLPTYSEHQLEEHWIKPILDHIGWQHTYETQAVIPSLEQKRIRKPDYIGFASREQRTDAIARQNTSTYAQDAIVIGEAKKWTVALNKKQKGKPTFENNNPSYQIDYYLRAADVRWGILTNGRYWRLVNKESSYKLDVYYEIDLQDIIENDSKNGLLYFWLFFRHGAFVPDSQGSTFVADALTASVNYAREVEIDLRDNAYKALEQLILGFFAFGRNGLSAENPDHLNQVYTNSLYLLYRLLFLLYGESRGLLPLHKQEYRDVSLTALVNEIATKVEKGSRFSPYSTQYWGRQQGLCHIINGTDPDANAYYGVPRYNGGLFSPDNHRFLEQYQMGDAYLLRAIDYLARRDRHKQGDYAIKERVDYRTLGVRQLGSIYEGLLEYRPARATEPMVTIRRKGNEVWIPASQRGRKTALEQRDVGDLYLATDKGERKATGSYYTPDYIVRYIVEQTLLPLLTTIEQTVAKLPEAERGAAYAAQVLSLKVLDPAMGSGHFLVAAAEYLALALTKSDYSAPDDLPDGVDEMDESERQALEKNYWLRRVTEACIYGVDKNGMAVELAKLSLWLTTVSADKPLSFLDHHLRHGDSLVGARLSDLQTLPSKRKATETAHQTALLDETQLTTAINLAVGGMMAIEHATSDSLNDIHLKEQLFETLREHVATWRTLANVWVSSYFGNGMSPQEYADIARHLQGKQTTATPTQLQSFLNHPAVTNNDYFHWELEFPEVFFDEHGRALKEQSGFDAIVGNPPYVAFTLVESTNRNFLQSYYRYYVMKGDLYILFIELAQRFIKQNNLVGLIIQNKWLHTNYGQIALKDIVQSTTFVRVIDLHDSPVFDVSAYPLILVFRKGGSTSLPIAKLDIKTQNADEIPTLLHQDVILSDAIHSVAIERITGDCVPLGKLCIQIGQGVLTGHAPAFIKSLENANTSKLEFKFLKRYFSGKDIDKYFVTPESQLNSLIFPYNDSGQVVPPSEIPEIIQWLSSFRVELEERKNFGSLFIDQGHHWYELKHSAPQMFGERFIFPEISLSNRFYFDEVGDVALIGSAYYLKRNDAYSEHNNLYLLGLLNSKLLTYLFQLNAPTIRGGYFRYQSRYISDIPIRILKDFELDAKNWHNQIVEQAQEIMRLKARIHNILTSFQVDIEGVTHYKVFNQLFGRGKWEQSIYKKVKAAQPFVQENSRRTVMLDASLGWNEAAFKGFVKLLAGKVRGMSDLLDVYRDYHADYRALTEKIARTDALIDQIVYKLYGLTDEEIAIVEASTT